MNNRFNINESEKNRIRGLHGMQVIKEQSISSPDGDDYIEDVVDVDVVDEPSPEVAEDDGKITKQEYRKLKREVRDLTKSMVKELSRIFKGKTVNLYNSEISEKTGIESEGEEEFGTMRIKKIKYNPRDFMQTTNSEEKAGEVVMVVMPDYGDSRWLRFVDKISRAFTANLLGAIKSEKNLILKISCNEGGSMWLEEMRYSDYKKYGLDAYEGQKANAVTNTKFMSDVQDVFCDSGEMERLKSIISQLDASKFVPDADYAQVDDQEGYEEIV